MAKAADRYYAVHPWKIIEEGFDPAYSRVSESVFSLANEAMGARGYFDEGGSVDSLRGAYVNGVYEVESLPRSYRGIIEKSHFMVPAADWLRTRVVLDGEELDLGKASFRDFRRELDLRAGTLSRSFVWQTRSGKELLVRFVRFMDMERRERAYQRLYLTALNFAGAASVTLGLSFDVCHEGRGRCFWQPERAWAGENMLALQARTLASCQEVFCGAYFDLPAPGITEAEGKNAFVSLTVPLEQGREQCLSRHAVVLYDRTEGEALWQGGMNALREAALAPAQTEQEAQKAYWDHWWRTSDIQLDPADETMREVTQAEQQGVRFCSFQLAQTYNGGSVRHNIGAKGLTGEAYNGHAFWDTEACCLPFYLFTRPEAARDLLMFRYHTLDQARERARMLDCRGACYPVATLSGEEACALWQHASLQLQPSTAVAYGIWHYVHLTQDREFLFDYGAEMLLEIARFLASRVERGSRTGQYGFYGVMGPDEFHMMVNNNAYTNYMGQRTLLFAAQTLEEMQAARPRAYAALAERTGLTPDEPGRFLEIARNMYLPRTPQGLFEQHDGYFDLPHTDLSAIPQSEFPLYDHWSYDRIYRSDMIKQPDVLMMLYLYNTSFSEQVKRVNYEFYEPRTIHESSLSPAIHSILAAELGKMDEAVRFFGYATRLDLDNYNRNTREGLHITSIAMAWANIVYGFAGLRSDGEGLSWSPRLPRRWGALSFSVLYRGRVIRVRMERDGTRFCLSEGEPLHVLVYGKDVLLTERECLVPRDGEA